MVDLSGELQMREALIDEILDLRWEILRAGLPRESANFEGDDEPTTHHFVAEIGSEIVGCATFLQRPFNHEPGWQLRGMAVTANRQGSGVGKRLLEFAESFV